MQAVNTAARVFQGGGGGEGAFAPLEICWLVLKYY